MNRVDQDLFPPPARFRASFLHESWYSLWSSLCLAQPLSRSEVLLMTGDLFNRHMLDPATVRLLKRQLERLLSGLGVPGERAALLSGADMDDDQWVIIQFSFTKSPRHNKPSRRFVS